VSLNRSAGGGFIQATVAAVLAHPVTMACWFNVDDITSFNTLMDIKYSGADTRWALIAKGDTAGDPIFASSVVTGTYRSAATSLGYSAGTWQHACGVFTSTISRAAFLNGGSKGTDTVSINPAASALDLTRIIGGASGNIAEAAIWNIALSDAEVAILAKPTSPLLIRPESLVFYNPLIRDWGHDWIGGLAFSITGAPDPTITNHPRVFYPG